MSEIARDLAVALLCLHPPACLRATFAELERRERAAARDTVRGFCDWPGQETPIDDEKRRLLGIARRLSGLQPNKKGRPA